MRAALALNGLKSDFLYGLNSNFFVKIYTKLYKFNRFGPEKWKDEI